MSNNNGDNVREIHVSFSVVPSAWLVQPQSTEICAVIIESANGQFGFALTRPVATVVRDDLSKWLGAGGIVVPQLVPPTDPRTPHRPVF